jgi:hypothetical protein
MYEIVVGRTPFEKDETEGETYHLQIYLAHS